MAKIEIPLKKDYAGAFKYWVDTNTENGVCTIPEYICKGIVGMLGKQPVATDTNVGDIISRQAAIGEVKKHYRAYDNDLLELITFDIERLLPAQPEQRWIPCSERLPEERDWYLGIFKEPDTGWINPTPFICDYLLGTKTKATTKEGWILKGHTDREEYIDYYFNLECVAWMPLPEPYKEGETI